jgi:hypothetical protein
VANERGAEKERGAGGLCEGALKFRGAEPPLNPPPGNDRPPLNPPDEGGVANERGAEKERGAGGLCEGALKFRGAEPPLNPPPELDRPPLNPPPDEGGVPNERGAEEACFIPLLEILPIWASLNTRSVERAKWKSPATPICFAASSQLGNCS